MRSRRAIAVLLVVTLLCALPPAAAAAGPPAAHRLFSRLAQLGGELELPDATPEDSSLLNSKAFSEVRFVNHDGYSIRVIAFGQTVGLRIARPQGRKGSAATTTYLARGRVTPTSIRASFGSLGSVQLHFQRLTRTLAGPLFDTCKVRGKGPIARFGLFVGSLRFRGEGGYTSAEVHRLHGGSIDIDALIACLRGIVGPERMELPSPRSPFLPTPLPGLLASGGHRAPPPAEAPTHPSDGPRPTVLLAQDAQPLSRTIFAALRGGHRRVRYVAAAATSEGPIAILRVATVTAGASSFAFDDSLSKARVSPPPPFEGSGLFEHGAGSTKSWGGSLAVSFLGAPHLPLTGTPFNVLLGQGF